MIAQLVAQKSRGRCGGAPAKLHPTRERYEDRGLGVRHWLDAAYDATGGYCCIYGDSWGVYFGSQEQGSPIIRQITLAAQLNASTI